MQHPLSDGSAGSHARCLHQIIRFRCHFLCLRINANSFVLARPSCLQTTCATSRLTLPSRGRFPAYGLQAPLMSNVRAHKTHVPLTANGRTRRAASWRRNGRLVRQPTSCCGGERARLCSGDRCAPNSEQAQSRGFLHKTRRTSVRVEVTAVEDTKLLARCGGCCHGLHFCLSDSFAEARHSTFWRRYSTHSPACRACFSAAATRCISPSR